MIIYQINESNIEVITFSEAYFPLTCILSLQIQFSFFTHYGKVKLFIEVSYISIVSIVL